MAGAGRLPPPHLPAPRRAGASVRAGVADRRQRPQQSPVRPGDRGAASPPGAPRGRPALRLHRPQAGHARRRHAGRRTAGVLHDDPPRACRHPARTADPRQSRGDRGAVGPCPAAAPGRRRHGAPSRRGDRRRDRRALLLPAAVGGAAVGLAVADADGRGAARGVRLFGVRPTEVRAGRRQPRRADRRARRVGSRDRRLCRGARPRRRGCRRTRRRGVGVRRLPAPLRPRLPHRRTGSPWRRTTSPTGARSRR